MQDIFREYDIRGVVGRSLTPAAVGAIGRAVATIAAERGEQRVAVGRDGRLSSPALSDALKDGLQAAGQDVIDIGAVPTPLLYYATHALDTRAGVMVTGSHNPPDYNGLKVVLDGEALYGEAIRELDRRIQAGRLRAGRGTEQRVDLRSEYVRRVSAAVRLARPLKVVVDCGNGIAGDLVPRLMRALGCEVVELYCEVDGRFPNHHPDPVRPENLADLRARVQAEQADVGLAFDGDADRLGVVTDAGEIVWPDRVMMLFARDALRRHPGAGVVYDVKCSARLARVISEGGGMPLLWKTGHSLIKARMRETGALLGGEMTGHFVLADEWFRFDDGLYAAARLLRILAEDPRSSGARFAAYPAGVTTPELRVEMDEGEAAPFIERLRERADFAPARLITVDGLRVEFEHGWGLVRASNTTPSLVLRFEADDARALAGIQDLFRRELRAIDPGLSLPF